MSVLNRGKPLAAVSFTRFVAEVLQVRLTPAQRVLCTVAFDGVDPIQLDASDRDIARQIFGDVDVVPPAARDVLAATCGARAGKSYLLGALRLLHLSLVTPLTTLAPGEQAFGLIIAPDLRLSRQTLRYVSGAAKGAPTIARLIAGETADSITLQRPDNRVVCVECLPATRGGSAVRGRSLVAALLDEAAFFRDDDYLVNDTEIFKAVAPRILPSGQLIIASTPWAEAGLLHELHTANYGKPTSALAAHAPTLLLRDDEHTRQLVERERARDPENASREFDAVPMVAGSGAFFDPVAIKACIDESMPLVAPAMTSGRVFCGLDTGFRKDPSAAVVVRATGQNLDHIEVAEVVEIRPAKGERLVPSATIKQLLQRAAFHGCREAVADQHYIESVREHANGFMVIEAPGGLEGKTIAYLAARTAISEGRVRIPAVQTRLIQQLREVISKPTPGGNLTISSPRRGGSHGDIASSFVLGVWASSRDRVIGYPKLHRANVGITADWGNGTPYRRTYGPGGSHDWETGKPIRQSRRGRFG